MSDDAQADDDQPDNAQRDDDRPDEDRARTQADALADRLLVAHRALREADLSADDKGRAARRLIALSDASKHDVARAAARLEAFLADLAEGRVAASE